MRNRATRRANQARYDVKAKWIASKIWGNPDKWIQVRHNRRVCSCYACSGADKPHHQELRAQAAEHDYAD
jgi:hypothetical protein